MFHRNIRENQMKITENLMKIRENLIKAIGWMGGEVQYDVVNASRVARLFRAYSVS